MSSTTGSPRDSTRDVMGTALRVIAAAAIVVGGLAHLQLYFDGYRDFPNANLGRSFVLNGLSSVVVGCALVASRHWVVRLAGIAVAGGTLVAFAVSRTDFGVFGLTERGLEPSPQAAIALVAELVAVAALVLTFLPAIGAGRDVQPSFAAPVALAVVAGTAIGAALWARTDDDAAGDPPADVGEEALEGEAPDQDSAEIVIDTFMFEPGTVTVEAGTAVTWTNQDRVSHTVDATDGAFASGNMASGESFSVELTEPGTYDYFCSIHPSMTATIVVE